MQSTTDIKSSATISIESCHTKFKADLDCLVIPSITEPLPQVKLNRKSIQFPSDNRIADPSFDNPGSIDLLIGAYSGVCYVWTKSKEDEEVRHGKKHC